MTFYEMEVRFEDSGKNFTVFTNLSIEGNVNSFKALIDNWSAGAEEFTKKSLIDYFMSKKSMMSSYYMFSTAAQVKKHFKYLNKK